MTRRKYYKLIGIIVLVTIAACNFTPLNVLFKLSVDSDHYQYSNLSGTVTFSEDWFKKRTISDVTKFRKVSPSCIAEGFENDTLMYRLFSKNPLAFWRWKEYFTDERYDLPFARWTEISNKRENYLNSLPATPCRDF